MSLVKYLTFLVVAGLPGLLWAAAPTPNSRWVQHYFDRVYAARSPYFVKGSGWVDSLLQSHKRWAATADAERTTHAADVLWADFCQTYPLQSDWLIQDRPDDVSAPDWGERLLRNEIDCELVQGLLARVLRSNVFRSSDASRPHVAKFADPAAGLAHFEQIHLIRRNLMLRQIPSGYRRWVFVKLPHTVLSGANHYSYTESLSDHPFYRTFRPGGELCVLSLDVTNSTSTRTLLKTDTGSLRDPEISFDARRLLFSWRKSGDQDDYHLYEMELQSGNIRPLTNGVGHADYEAIYVPNGDIVFNSTRCVQSIDCDSNVVSNLYTCDRDGRLLRRLGFDQVTVNYPKLLPDGRVIYTRWEYNDRSQVWPQPLFQMNPDGTGQTEYYGNNSWFPTSILHARPIPNSRKLIAVLSGHHTNQKGKLAVIDVAGGNQEAQGVLLVAPESKPKAEQVDAWGTEGDQFKYPYAIDEDLYVVSFSAYEGFKPFMGRTLGAPFWLYLVNRSGERELLAADPTYSCLEATPLAARTPPPARPSTVDYRKTDGVFFLQDVHQGQGLTGIPRGTIRGLRVVELIYRHYPVGNLQLAGPGGGSVSRTPVALNNGTYDVKRVLGEARVYADGSACFTAPARTPIYFQAIDRNGHVVQTMRSWATLQPGERMGCVGCHETKYDTPPPRSTLALQHGPQQLTPFYGEARPFSYRREIQPILDKHCVSCHDGPRWTSGLLADTAVTASASHFFPGNSPAALNDGREPRSSGDLGLPRFTFWPHKGTEEWVQYTFRKPIKVDSVAVYWFDTGPNGPWCRKPEWWKLLGRSDVEWKELGSVSGDAVRKDTFDPLKFDSVMVRDLRIVAKFPEGWSGGILEWRVAQTPERVASKPGDKKAFSLRGHEALVVPEAKRNFSDSYLYFCCSGATSGAAVKLYAPNPLVNWMNVQEVPTLLPPYHAGAAKSRLITLLQEGHEGVHLNQEELDKIACWIDLLVPYCGDYREANAWTAQEIAEYEKRIQKRLAMEVIETQGIRDYIQERQSP